MYPDAFPGVRLEAALDLPEPSKMRDLWRIVNKSLRHTEVFVSYPPPPGKPGKQYDDDSLVQLNPQLVSDLANIADHERWVCAQEWARVRLNRTPNRAEQAWHKQAFSSLCELARRAVAVNAMLIVVQEA
jgi:hypothetical protein